MTTTSNAQNIKYLQVGDTVFSDTLRSARFVDAGDDKWGVLVSLGWSKKAVKYFRKWAKKPHQKRLVIYRELSISGEIVQNRFVWCSLYRAAIHNRKHSRLDAYVSVHLINGEFTMPGFLPEQPEDMILNP